MIWKAPTSGNTYYRSFVELVDGEAVEYGGVVYRVTGCSWFDERGERPYYWHFVEEAA